MHRSATVSRCTASGTRGAACPITLSHLGEAAREVMQPLDSGLGDQHHLAGLHAGFVVARHHVRLNDHRLPGAERLLRDRPGRPALRAQNRRQVSAAIAMQKIVDDFSESRRAQIVGRDEQFWITRTNFILDQEGLGEALEAAGAYEAAMDEIASRSAARRIENGTDGDDLPVSSSIAFFKMPPRGE